jgi:hypothetical protein
MTLQKEMSARQPTALNFAKLHQPSHFRQIQEETNSQFPPTTQFLAHKIDLRPETLLVPSIINN